MQTNFIIINNTFFLVSLLLYYTKQIYSETRKLKFFCLWVLYFMKKKMQKFLSNDLLNLNKVYAYG